MNAFFVGIGGMGMSGLARILHTTGSKVSGSDRNLNGEYCQALRNLGIDIQPQDGTGLSRFLSLHSLSPSETVVVKSTAVEDNVPDIVAARELKVSEIMRSDLLAQMFNEKKGIAVAGTAGKTTTSGILAWIFSQCGRKPSAAIGGMIAGLDTNAFHGSGEHFVIEADESDGSIVKYRPHISLLTNIHRDHKPLEELSELFEKFFLNTVADGRIIVCSDNPGAVKIAEGAGRGFISYGLSSDCDYCAFNIETGGGFSSFDVKGTGFRVPLIGEHNIRNVVGAAAAAAEAGIPMVEISAALSQFKGMKRRFEHVGTAAGVTVIDDFAHNPVEIQAAVSTARLSSRRRFVVYQPHGFGPTRFTRNDLVSVFKSLQQDEFLFLDDIFYGGGTVEKDISSSQLVEEVKPDFPNAFYPGSRKKIIGEIVSMAEPGDMVLVMGARDINAICKPILENLGTRHL